MRIPSSSTMFATVETDVKMTPMIDVVFLLMVYFVWSASFQIAEYELPSSLSTPSGQGQAIAAELIDLERVAIRIAWQNDRPAWLINGRSVDGLPAVRETLAGVAAVSPELPIVLDPDADVPLGDVIDVYDIARQQGFTRVQFVAVPPP